MGLGLIGLMEGPSLVWSEIVKGVLHWSPWKNHLTFKLWHLGHNTCYEAFYIVYMLCGTVLVLQGPGPTSYDIII